MKKLVDEFLNVEDTPGPRGQLERKDRPQAEAAPAPDGGGPRGRHRLRPDQAARRRSQQGAGRDACPVLYPTLRTQGLASTPGRRASTGSAAERASSYRAYRMVINRAVAGEYYGLQGTTWKDPPILEDASETREIGGRKYELHYDGDRLRLVAWRTDKGVLLGLEHPAPDRCPRRR